MRIDALEEVKRLIREGRVSRDEVVRQLYVELQVDNRQYTSQQENHQVVRNVQPPKRQIDQSVNVENIAERQPRSQEDVIELAKAAAKANNQQERRSEVVPTVSQEKREEIPVVPKQPQYDTAGLSEIEKYVRSMSKKVIESEIPLIQNHWAPELTIVDEKISREEYLDLLMKESRRK